MSQRSITYAVVGWFGLVGRLVAALMAITCATTGVAIPLCSAQDRSGPDAVKNDAAETSTDEQALSMYADAANFQTQGELKLAIEQWQRFLKDFAADPMAPRAAHYLGVCYMQLPQPNYQLAADSFSKALKSTKYSLREESLSNLGWCFYALAKDPQNPEPAKLAAAIKVFEQIMAEFPATKFADRALFYHGEALYAQGKAKEAIGKYDQLLTSRFAKDSSMRCDALYAKGVAHEDLKEYDAAVQVYREMLSSCSEDPLAQAAKNHLAEVFILQGKFADANTLFEQLIAAGGDGVPRALYRRAFVMTQLKRAEEAASIYDRIVKEFPDSEYAASAILSSAQGYYIAGDFDAAKQRFEAVLANGTNRSASTEASHWLSVMAIRRGDAKEAETIARRQIQQGVEGPYAVSLRLEAAEATGMQPNRSEEALAEFEQILAMAPNDPLLSRILYNGAFTAMQLRQSEKALSFTNMFFEKLPSDPLTADMYYITAESYLLDGNVEQAIGAYDQLLKAVQPDNPQLAFWILRTAIANFSGRNFDTVIGILEERMPEMKAPAEKAEAQFLIGSSLLSTSRPAEAISAFDAGLAADPQWRRTDEMLLRKGTAHLLAEQVEQALTTWKTVISRFPQSRIADQARYQLAQQALTAQNYPEALQWYDDLMREGADAVLRPYSLYGKGRTYLQAENYEAAISTLNQLVEQFPQHAFYGDGLLARGVAFRRLKNLPQAAADLSAFLELKPEGINLGNALFELAIVDRERQRPQEAIANLQRIINELPDYPELDKVRFEQGELLWEMKDEQAAVKAFTDLLEQNSDSSFVPDASYKIGQYFYANQRWKEAADAYRKASQETEDPGILERSLYRLGWSFFQQKQYDQAAEAFQRQAMECSEGPLSIDALMMMGECYFNKESYEEALGTYEQARKVILDRDGNDGRPFSDPAEQQVRELVFLHGGQSAAQLQRWKEALEWYDALRSRYPSSSYISQVFYETGLAYKMSGNNDSAVKFFTEAANKFRDESGARSRFMIGQVYFEQEKLADAINEFKRVMYGYGAEKAAEPIRDWQAKSGFEAGRCAERLIQLNQGERRQEAIEFAKKYYEYVVENHAKHPLASKSRERAEVLKRL